MCGRFTLSSKIEDLRDYLYTNFDIDDFGYDFFQPRYNIAPGQNILSIINDGTKYRVGYLKWGFVPFFAKDEKIGYKMINAKSETIDEKSSFKNSFTYKRCIILADGFYEWLKEDKKKIPYRILLKDNSVFPMAGLWSTYTKEDGTKLHSCTIITTAANPIVFPIHDRMPVILTNESKEIWLNPNVKDIETLKQLLIPYNPDKMHKYQVSSIVNSPANDSIECINSY